MDEEKIEELLEKIKNLNLSSNSNLSRNYVKDKGTGLSTGEVDKQREYVLKKLKPFSNPNVPLLLSSIKRLKTNKMSELYLFLNGSIPTISPTIKKSRNNLDFNNISSFKYEYRESMNNYIKQWNFSFENLSCTTPALLEATANYLNKNYTKNTTRKK